MAQLTNPIACKNCEKLIDFDSAVRDSPFSWPKIATFWHECSGCKTGNHIKITSGSVSIVEIIGAPSPEWTTLQTTLARDIEIVSDPAFLKVWSGAFHRAIPARP